MSIARYTVLMTSQLEKPPELVDLADLEAVDPMLAVEVRNALAKKTKVPAKAVDPEVAAARKAAREDYDHWMGTTL